MGESNSDYDGIVLNERDNVCTVLRDVRAREEIILKEGNQKSSFVVKENVPLGHKCALVSIKAGKPVIKYGEQIGIASTNIPPGSHVHTHHLESRRGRGDI